MARSTCSRAWSSSAADRAAARMVLTWSSPTSLRCSVVIGVKISSSWSAPAGLRPLAASTPTTRRRNRSTRIAWPSGLGSPGKSLDRTVWPMTQTSAASSVSCRVKKRPEVVFQSRTAWRSDTVPLSSVGHWAACEAANCRVSWTSATPLRNGPASLRTMAASSRVSGVASVTTPECDRAPGRTTIRFLPTLSMLPSSFCCTPSPADTMAMTAPMPMMMPRQVKNDRPL